MWISIRKKQHLWKIKKLFHIRSSLIHWKACLKIPSSKWRKNDRSLNNLIIKSFFVIVFMEKKMIFDYFIIFLISFYFFFIFYLFFLIFSSFFFLFFFFWFVYLKNLFQFYFQIKLSIWKVFFLVSKECSPLSKGETLTKITFYSEPLEPLSSLSSIINILVRIMPSLKRRSKKNSG